MFRQLFGFIARGISLILRAVVPPDQQCILQGCTKHKYVEPSGRVHDFCGRTHSREYAKQQQQSQGSKSSFVSTHTACWYSIRIRNTLIKCV